MKKFIIISLAAIGIGAAGCKKNLDVVNQNAPNTTIFWKTADDAQKGVNAMYSTFHRAGICRWMFFATMVRADEGWSTSPDANLQNNFDQFINNDYNYGNFTGIWNDLYIGINRTNQVLDNVPSINMDATLRNRYIGEAKFMRALFYYHLASLWGNVPMQLKSSTPTDFPTTSTRDQVWAQVQKDLTEAAAVLPVSYTGGDVGLFRFINQSV